MYTEKLTARRRRSSNLINSIVSTLHAKSPFDAQHARNVSVLCEQIGRKMNLPLSEIYILKEAGYLHNIGKVILDEGLLNTGKELSERELQQYRQHPVVGYKILSSAEQTLELAQAVLNYCEHWDGSGYPQGLSGREIPKLARIIAVADYYDTLVSGTPNQKRIGKKAAAARLRELAGTRFDPEIVEIFVEMLNE
jgi:HD-GYP domain-containing protein (c-di-GMP phosphodiesterase class II)